MMMRDDEPTKSRPDAGPARTGTAAHPAADPPERGVEFGGDINTSTGFRDRPNAASGAGAAFQGWQQTWQQAVEQAREAQALNMQRMLRTTAEDGSIVPGTGFDSVPHTPDSQIPPQYGDGGSYTMHRFGSVSSISTTDDEEAPQSSEPPWTDGEEQLVRQAYDDLVSDPRTTPFSGRFPPSGVVHRVAKDTLKLAKAQRVQFPHSFTAVRRRILMLYTGSSGDDEIDAYATALEHQVPPADFTIPSEDVDMTDDFEFETTSHAPRAIPSKYQEASMGPGILPPESGVARSSIPLASPFKETPAHLDDPIGIGSGLDEESIVNIVAKRKRDSLRMKRGVR